MAYVDKQPLSHRLANLGTAGLIQVGIGVALIAGLSTTFVPQPKLPPVTATDIPLDPAQPEPPPTADPIESEITVLTPPVTFNPIPDPMPTTPVIDSPITPTIPNGETPTPQPSARPSPLTTPISASPRNDPGTWVTRDDYPPRDLREGNQGTTGFRVIVGSNGRVQSCEITRSSGFASLDKATCDKVSRRARFDAATDDTGARIVGTYTSAVVWRIPR